MIAALARGVGERQRPACGRRSVRDLLADEHGGRLDDSAFIEILCRRALEGGGAAERPAHQLALTVCEACERGWQDGAGREIEVGPEVVERARCDAEWIGALDAAHPERVTSTVTPRLRRQVFARDHHRCTVPGCRSARNLDLHHIEYQCDGGRHQIWNLISVCTGHHARLHEGALKIRGRAPDASLAVRRSGGLTVEAGDGAPAVARVLRPPGHEEDGSSPAVEVSVAPRPVSRTRSISLPAQIDRGGRGTCVRLDECLEREARDALTAAGYKPHEARAAVERASGEVGPSVSLEQLIRRALQCCAIPRRS